MDYKIKALIGLVGVYFLLKDVVTEKEESNNYTYLVIWLIVLVILYIINILIKKKNDKNVINYDVEIQKVTSSNLHIEKKVMELDKILNKKSDYGRKMHLLNHKERDLVYIENLQREVNNGGFHQFYLNSSGNYAIETEKAYRKIKANKTSAIIEKANNEFPNKFIPTDREKRIEILFNIEDIANKTWKECDRKIFTNEEYYFEPLYNYFTSK